MRKNIKPWDKRQGESEPAYSAFIAYLHMNETHKFRNISELAKILSKSRQLLDGWRRKWKWKERVDAWDRENLEQERVNSVNERRKTAKNHMAIGRALQQTALEALQKIRNADTEIYFKDIISALNIGVRIEKEATEAEFREKRLELEIERLNAEIEKIRAEVGHKYVADGEYEETEVCIYMPEKESEE